MQILYCDETNLEARDNTFFIYGGITFATDQAYSLHEAIERIRRDRGIPPGYCLKFNPGPENLQHDAFKAMKQEVIEATIAHGGRLLVSIILHDLATSPEDARRNEINRVLLHFNGILSQNNDHGLVLIDRFTDRQIDEHLRAKFSVGVTGLPYSSAMRLNRIVGFHYSAIGQSHFGSLVDVILGSFRLAVNAHCAGNGQLLPTARRLLEILAPLFAQGPQATIPESYLFFSPKRIRSDTFRRKYQSVKDFLQQNGIPASQEITDIRMY